MTAQQLYTKLTASYTQENLQKITRTIIALHKNHQTQALLQLLNVVESHQSEKNSSVGRVFYKLMMTYHPDRVNVYRNEIETFHTVNNINGLRSFAHIFTALELEHSSVVLKKPETNSSAYSDLWESMREDFEQQEEEEYDEEQYDEFVEEFDDAPRRNTFFNVFKRQMYGTLNVELPAYSFEDIETLDLSGCEMESLDGIQYCTELAAVDLSNNRIDDVTELASLSMLQEVYLAGNRIGYIDALAFLTNLRAVDLSYNNIDDLSPLFDLDQLEYVNAAGNPVPRQHIAILQKKGGVIIS
jgi:Leucine-rich repeat (LRR) protein